VFLLFFRNSRLLQCSKICVYHIYMNVTVASSLCRIQSSKRGRTAANAGLKQSNTQFQFSIKNTNITWHLVVHTHSCKTVTWYHLIKKHFSKEVWIVHNSLSSRLNFYEIIRNTRYATNNYKYEASNHPFRIQMHHIFNITTLKTVSML